MAGQRGKVCSGFAVKQHGAVAVDKGKSQGCVILGQQVGQRRSIVAGLGLVPSGDTVAHLA